jgi:hypothetical protein
MSTRNCCSPSSPDTLCPAGPLTRPHFFAGQCLTEDDLNAMQNYLVERQQRHNRFLHGVGVVNGLQVCSHQCPGWLKISAGFAIGPCGEEIFVPEDYEFDLCGAICHLYPNFNNCNGRSSEHEWQVRIRYAETECGGVAPQPSKTGKCGCGCGDTKKRGKTGNCRCQTTHASPVIECQPSRIRECFRIDVVPDVARQEANTFVGIVSKCLSTSNNDIEAARILRGGYDVYKEDTQPYALQALANALRDGLQKILSKSNCTVIVPSCDPCSDGEQFSEYLNTIDRFLRGYTASCICNAILPSPSISGKSNEIVLATVKTASAGNKSTCRIIHICNLKNRQQMITLPTLEYWFSRVPELWKRVEAFCCSPDASRMFAGRFQNFGNSVPNSFSDANPAPTKDQILKVMLQILAGGMQ